MNPLLEGLRSGIGEILGVSTAWPKTGREDDRADLPTNLEATSQWLVLPILDKQWRIHEGQQICQHLVVGDTEVARLPQANGQVYYAHNTDELFGSLVGIRSGTSLLICQPDALETFTYRTQSVVHIDEVALRSLEPAANEIWLITCRDTDSPWRIVYSFEKV